MENIPDPLHVVKIEDMKTPELKANEIMIQVEAALYDYNDLWAIWGEPTKAPPGHIPLVAMLLACAPAQYGLITREPILPPREFQSDERVLTVSQANCVTGEVSLLPSFRRDI